MSECKVCEAPLGQESIDSGYTVCHDHRRCPRCKATVPSTEVNWCLENAQPVMHSRCLIVDDKAVAILKLDKARFIELVNMVHLVAQYTSLIGEGIAGMSFDEKYSFVIDLQRITVETSIILKKDKDHYERGAARQAGDRVTRERIEKDVKDQIARLPSERKKRTKEDKFIDGLIKSIPGMTREAAAAMWSGLQVQK